MLIQSDLLLSQEEFLKGISETYRDLFISKKYADVTLVTDDKLHIPAHRFILSKLNVTLVTSQLSQLQLAMYQSYETQ